jgi:L-alanine-DL-glutamate epimerase-like enolase superfamily enzyme
MKITDLGVATIVKPGPSPCPMIRINTNQGVYGLGEVRDGTSPTYALFLKSRIVGENPLQRDNIFRKIKHRNPQTFVLNIFLSTPEDYRKAVQRIYRAPAKRLFL